METTREFAKEAFELTRQGVSEGTCEGIPVEILRRISTRNIRGT